jgi:hypothetical protein
MDNILIFNCPHCEHVVEVEKNGIKCGIFRHGYYFLKNGDKIILLNQINPHESKENCDRLVSENKIVGCGKPFRINADFSVSICEYI